MYLDDSGRCELIMSLKMNIWSEDMDGTRVFAMGLVNMDSTVKLSAECQTVPVHWQISTIVEPNK